jgi:hypothetical protein
MSRASRPAWLPHIPAHDWREIAVSAMLEPVMSVEEACHVLTTPRFRPDP